MCPVTRTDFFTSTRTGKRECWGAVSGDGVWHMVREESPGTPWLLYHWPSVTDKTWELPVEQLGTLAACREHVARGRALISLARRKAEAAGWAWTGAAWVHDKTGATAPGGWDDPPAHPVKREETQ